MKLLKKISAAILMIVFLASCGAEQSTVETGDAQDVDSTATAEAVDYAVDTEASIINWIGSKATGDAHNGTIGIKEGTVSVKDGEIVGGSYTIDMNSFIVLDLEDEEQNMKLSTHLKDTAFFFTSEYPEAVFTITNVKAYEEGDITIAEGDEEYFTAEPTHTITGNFKMRGEEKSITIPAKVTVNDTGVEAEAKFNIDRTLWGVNYNSEESLGDKFINKAVNLELKLAATK